MPRKRATMTMPSSSEMEVSQDISQIAFSARASFEKVVKKSEAFAPKEMGSPKIGIPIDGCLPLQYLLGIDVLPLHQAISLVGKPGSFKSQMAWYFASKFLLYEQAPGICVYLDVEQKTNDRLVRGIIQNDYVYSQNILSVKDIKTVNDLSLSMAKYSEWYDAAVVERNHPMVYVLDSLGALVSSKETDQYFKSGDVNDAKGYLNLHRASDITNHFKTWTLVKLHERPMALIIVNHLKEKIPEPGGGASFIPQKGSPGGAHKDFMNLATIEMIRERGGAKLRSESRIKVWMQTIKAATADTGLKICATIRIKGPNQEKYQASDIMLDSMNDHPEDFQRYHVDVDWDTSLIELLTRETGKVTIEKAKLKEVCWITGSGNKLSCSQVGLKDVSPKELGAAIHANPHIVKELQNVLRISREPHFAKPKPR